MSGNAEIISAYERMLQSGKANEKIIISQPTPDNPSGKAFGGGGFDDPLKVATGEEPIGKKINETDDSDYSEFDSKMRNLIEAKKKKAGITTPDVDEFSKLKNRVKKVEEALMLIMETHTKLLNK